MRHALLMLRSVLAAWITVGFCGQQCLMPTPP
jgi:hypothetical protein